MDKVLRRSLWKINNFNSWSKYFPFKTNCQICNKEIFWNHESKSKNIAINFDHKNGGKEKIKGSPSKWLRLHKCTKENVKHWEDNGFGYLCQVCNKNLPTINRVEWLVKALIYMGEEAKALVSPSSLPTPT